MIAQNNAFVFLMDHRSVLKGWRSSHVHGRTAGFVSRSDPAEDSAPVSTQIGRIQVVCTRRYGAVRSFFGGFSSTAGYVPGNEARRFPEGNHERHKHLWADHFPLASLVFIRETSIRPFGLMPAKPFGFGPRRSWTAAFRSFCPRTVCHHLRSTSRSRSKCP